MQADWTRVRQLVEQAARPPEMPAVQGLAAPALRALEQRLGGAVPAELASWLALVNGAPLGPGGLFGFACQPAELDMQYYWELYPGWLRKGWVPLAGDGCGNYYLLVPGAADQHPVIFVDTMAEPEQAAYAVASSLAAFLVFYLEEDRQRTGWPFDRHYVLQRDPALAQVPDLPLPWAAG